MNWALIGFSCAVVVAIMADLLLRNRSQAKTIARQKLQLTRGVLWRSAPRSVVEPTDMQGVMEHFVDRECLDLEYHYDASEDVAPGVMRVTFTTPKAAASEES